jgi:hypothetical protein
MAGRGVKSLPISQPRTSERKSISPQPTKTWIGWRRVGVGQKIGFLEVRKDGSGTPHAILRAIRPYGLVTQPRIESKFLAAGG